MSYLGAVRISNHLSACVNQLFENLSLNNNCPFLFYVCEWIDGGDLTSERIYIYVKSFEIRTEFGCPDGDVTCISFWTSHLCTHTRCGGKSTYLGIVVDKIFHACLLLFSPYVCKVYVAH